MSIHWITWVWDESPLRETKLLVHLALADIAHHDGRFFASQQQIAQMARCTPRYVSQVVTEMEAAGLIRVVSKGSGRGRATVYQLLGRTERVNHDAPFTKPERVNYATERVKSEPERVNSAPNHSSYTPVLFTRPEGDTVAETEGQRINRLARTYTDRVPLCNFSAVAGVVRKAVKADRYSDQQITDSLGRLADDGRPVTADTLRIELEGMTPRDTRKSATRMYLESAQRLGDQPNLALAALGGPHGRG